MSDNIISILSINTWKNEGDYTSRIKVMTAQLEVLKPSIVLCQECFLTKDHTADTLSFLAQKLNMNFLFTAARFKPRLYNKERIDSYSGLGVLSVFPCSIIKELDLPSCPQDGGRKAQIVSIALPFQKKLLLANIHLTHLPHATALRCDQLNVVADALTSIDEDGIKMIGGDYNAEVNSMEILSLIKNFNAMDCYTLGTGSKTRPLNDFQIKKSVDHIVVLPNKGVYPTFINSATVLNQPGGEKKLYASDHPGIITSLVLNS